MFFMLNVLSFILRLLFFSLLLSRFLTVINISLISFTFLCSYAGLTPSSSYMWHIQKRSTVCAYVSRIVNSPFAHVQTLIICMKEIFDLIG